jgi:ketosteroid isomerase-like protein
LYSGLSQVELALVEPKDPSREPNEGDALQPNSSADEFFSKMNRDFRRPKPSEEAVAAALQAIQALAGDAVLEDGAETASVSAAAPEPGTQCPKCSGVNSGSNRFCGFCGAALEGATPAAKRTASAGAEQHVHHHHYHHHYFPSKPIAGPESPLASDSSSTLSAGETAESKETHTVLRDVVRAWALAFNAQRLDELCRLYSEDALLVRPGAALVRGWTEVKEVLQSELESGFGDVRLDCSEIGVIGDIACLAGVSRMLAPIAPGNRQERTGKFLMLVHREAEEWKLLADVWCVDTVEPPQSLPKPRK